MYCYSMQTTTLERCLSTDSFGILFLCEQYHQIRNVGAGGACGEHVAGFGEEPEGKQDAPCQQAPARENIGDDTIITMKSGDLRQVIDAYRKLSRFAREGKIPTQDQRMKGHASVKAVKHLIRKPIK